MEDFIKYLEKKYTSSVIQLSKTGYDNKVASVDFDLINFEKMSEDIQKINPKFKGNNFATADALFISHKNELILHFIEFKNMDFKDEKDNKMSKYWLEKCLTKMRDCDNECFIHDKNDDIYKSNFQKYLIDKSIANMRLKPTDSLSVLFHHFLHLKMMNHIVVVKFFILKNISL